MTQEYWKWPESSWTSETIDWEKAETITAGVDVGTTSTQVAILCDGKLFGYANLHTGSNFGEVADKAIKKSVGSSGMTITDIGNIVATGFGSGNVTYATKTLDEIQCHGLGARFIFGSTVTTVVDLGGQTSKAIRLYDWDRVQDFKLSDKCATGMGRNIEVIAELMQIPIEEMGEMSLNVENDRELVSTTCYNFINPELIGLFRSGYKEDSYSENDVLASYFFTIAWRILGMIGKLSPFDVGEIQIYKELAFTGGLAKNKGIVRRLERELDITALSGEYDPQLAGAIGAALLA